MRFWPAALVILLAAGEVHASEPETTPVSIKGECSLDEHCEGRKVCHAHTCVSPHTANGGSYLMGLGGGLMLPAVVSCTIGILLQVPSKFAFEGKHGNMSITFLTIGGVAGLAGLSLVIAGAVFRKRYNDLHASLPMPMFALVPDGGVVGLSMKF